MQCRLQGLDEAATCVNNCMESHVMTPLSKTFPSIADLTHNKNQTKKPFRHFALIYGQMNLSVVHMMKSPEQLLG